MPMIKNGIVFYLMISMVVTQKNEWQPVNIPSSLVTDATAVKLRHSIE